MRFVLADRNLVVAGRTYEGLPLLIGDDGGAIQPAQQFIWHLVSRAGRVGEASWEVYGRAIYDFFAFAITNGHDWRNPAMDGRPSALEAWRDWSLGTLGLASRTINQRIRVVVRFYKWAVRKGLIDAEPFDYVEVQTSRGPGFLAHVDERGGKVSTPEILLKEAKGEVRILTREQIALCHEVISNLTHRLLFELMVRTGMRQIEARTFPDAYVFDPAKRRDLNPDQKIRITLNPKDMRIKFSKSRDIDVPYDLMEKMWAYSVRHRQGRANNHPEGAEFPPLFLTEGGVPYSRGAVVGVFATLSKRVGFKVEAHMLRHTYATYLLWSLRKSTKFEGDPLLYVRDRLGHSDVSTTTDYLHLVNSLEGQLVLAHEDEIDQLFATS